MNSNILTTTLSLLLFLLISNSQAKCTYHGPYLLWGKPLSEYNNANVLTALQDYILKSHYSNSDKIIIFIKNSNTKLNEDSFPQLSNIIQNNKFIFSSQDALTLDPNDFNKNVLIVNLNGTPQQQDAEMANIYWTAQKATQPEDVLYVLASQSDNCHVIKRRQIENESTTENINVYDGSGKVKLYSKEPPSLTIKGERMILKSHTVATSRESAKNNTLQLQVTFLDPSKNSQKIIIRFNFVSRNMYWYLTYSEVSDDLKNYTLLNVVGNQPNAPINKSFTCRTTLEFRDKNNTTSLIFKSGYQIQPWMSKAKFDDAFDCNGYSTAPIWSGILVTLLLGFILTIALIFLSDIRIYDIQNKSSKQLSFTVQE